MQLNVQVRRFAADLKAAQNIAKYYETSGDIAHPPRDRAHHWRPSLQLFWHLGLYGQKLLSRNKAALFTPIQVNRYGHCTFTQAEMAFAFNALLQKVAGQGLPLVG